jgi:hypothetical protein
MSAAQARRTWRTRKAARAAGEVTPAGARDDGRPGEPQRITPPLSHCDGGRALRRPRTSEKMRARRHSNTSGDLPQSGLNERSRGTWRQVRRHAGRRRTPAGQPRAGRSSFPRGPRGPRGPREGRAGRKRENKTRSCKDEARILENWKGVILKNWNHVILKNWKGVILKNWNHATCCCSCLRS